MDTPSASAMSFMRTGMGMTIARGWGFVFARSC
jgi:hypothetical protein